MKEDPAIKKIRQIRHKISEEFDHDPEKLVKYYMEFQEKYQGRLISTTKEKKQRISK